MTDVSAGAAIMLRFRVSSSTQFSVPILSQSFSCFLSSFKKKETNTRRGVETFVQGNSNSIYL